MSLLDSRLVASFRSSWICVLALFLSGCATYAQDLQRVRDHYQASEFPQSLALLRVLGNDLDSLSERERVEYAYLRGMTDYRLSEAAPSGETREGFRRFAQKYLAVAAGLDRQTPEGLTDEQRQRMRDSLSAIENGTD